MKKRYYELDAIRGIAALMVVLFHYTIRYSEIYENPIDPLFSFPFGEYGVQLFFIVSGFVIFLTLNRTTNSIDFIVSRFSRLYPVYWFSVVFTFIVVFLFSLPGREVDVQTALINLTMIQKWLGVENVDGVYWTLALELSFYIIMYCLFITKQLKRIHLISIIWLIIIIGSKFFEEINNVNIHGAIKLLFLLEYGNLFIAGIMFYKIMHERRNLDFVVLCMSLIAEYYLHGNTVFLIALYFVLFFLFATGNLRILSIKPLMYLGTISYSLYLIHQNVGYIIIRQLDANNMLNPISIIIVPLTIVIAIAALMQRYIEKPSLAFIRDKWKTGSFRRNLIKSKK
jgi:peptidoglycan/LPS O-acetylase OafA/YrhL